MDIQVTVEFVLKSGITKQVKWIESNPRLIQKNKETGEVVREIPLSKEELKREIVRKLVAEKKPFVVEGVDGKVYYVDLNETALLGVEVEETERQLELVSITQH